MLMIYRTTTQPPVVAPPSNWAGSVRRPWDRDRTRRSGQSGSAVLLFAFENSDEHCATKDII